MTDSPESRPGRLPPLPQAEPEIGAPSPNWLRTVFPFFIAAAILYYVLHDQDWHRILDAFKHCRLALFVTGAMIYTLGFFIIDTASTYCTWNWFIVRIPPAEMIKLRGAMMIFHATFESLASLVTLLYMIRKKHVHFLPGFSLGFFLTYCDVWAYLPAFGLALGLEHHLPLWVYLLFAGFLLDQFFWLWFFLGSAGRRRLPRLYSHPLALAMREAKPRHLLQLSLLRLFWPVLQVTGHLLALHAMHIHPPFPVVIVVALFMTMTAFLPISAGGFGAPNWVVLSFAPYARNNLELVTAYGLLFQFCFLFGRLLIGAGFFYPFWKEVLRDHPQELIRYAEESENRN